MASSSTASDDNGANVSGRAQDVYDRLREEIISLRLLPGERVSERALETMLGSSRTPIREALLRLEGEGLINRQERGHRVAPIELAEVMEAFECREHLEAAVAQLACERASPADIDAIQAILDAGLGDDTTATWFAIGTDFHVKLAELSGNRFLVRAITDVLTRIERARWIMASVPNARAEAHDEHSHILRLIKAKRADDAAEALALHARALRDRLADGLSENRQVLRARGFDVMGLMDGK